MHPDSRVLTITPLDHAFHAAGCYRAGQKLDEIWLGFYGTLLGRTGFVEMLPKRIVLHVQSTSGLVQSVLLGQDNRLPPKFLRQSGPFGGLLATPEIKLVTRLG